MFLISTLRVPFSIIPYFLFLSSKNFHVDFFVLRILTCSNYVTLGIFSSSKWSVKHLAKMTSTFFAVRIPAALLGSTTLRPWNDLSVEKNVFPALPLMFIMLTGQVYYMYIWSNVYMVCSGQYYFIIDPLASSFCGGQVVYAWRATCCVCECVWANSQTTKLYCFCLEEDTHSLVLSVYISKIHLFNLKQN